MTRVPLFERLPAIHRIQDATPSGDPGPLQAFLKPVEDAFSEVKSSIEALYHDLFIDTCADWVIPYIGDLLGTSHLAGEPRTLRADVADTILLRRAKGTLGAIERVAHDLTGWGAHPVELRENLAWAQSLNHQRPDRGGEPAYRNISAGRHTVIRGGFATLRDPAMLSLVGTPFDQFARFPDVSIAEGYRVGHNLPNLAIFLWRLASYEITTQVELAMPSPPIVATTHSSPDAAFVVRVFVDPLARPVRLFGRSSYDAARRPPIVTPPDEQPAPIPRARLGSPPALGTPGSFAGNPRAYVAVQPYDPTDPASLSIGSTPLQLHVPLATLDLDKVRFRGANLCAWEEGLVPPLADNEVAIDPVTGRIAIGVATQPVAQRIVDDLVLTYRYGGVGDVGATPIARSSTSGATIVDHTPRTPTLEHALGALATPGTGPLVIEIADNEVHELDLSVVTGAVAEGGTTSLSCARSLVLRATGGMRPIVRLAVPLRFRVADLATADRVTVQLDGITFVAGETMPATEPLIGRAAVASLDIRGCTLDPGGGRVLDGTPGGGRAPWRASFRLAEGWGFATQADRDAFAVVPKVSLFRTISGGVFVDADAYHLSLTGTIVDVGRDGAATAIAGAGDPTTSLAPDTIIDGVTIFGRSRFQRIHGRGGIFGGRLFVDDDQSGCLKLCWFSADGDRLPQNTGCVDASDALLAFTSEVFGEPAYGQLSLRTDRRIRERGPNDDQMGAYGFLLEAHKWKNLTIRLRELTPTGVRALLIPAT